jgi:hypothetical protein
MKAQSLAFVISTAVLSLASVAEGQTRTVCVQLGFLDQRYDCPTAGTAGARFPCNPGGTSSSVGMVFELLDRDTAPDGDDFIGTWRTAGTGVQCGTFNWTDASDDPDLYVNFFPRVRGEVGGSRVIGYQNVGTAASPNWQEYGYYTTRNWGAAVNCAAGQTCYILPGQTVLPSGDPNSDASGVWAALDSAMRPLKYFHSGVNGTQDIRLEIDELSQWPSTEQCNFACGRWRDEVRLPFDGPTISDLHLDGDRVSHELGHLLELREFGKDGWHYDCPGGWEMSTVENDACATAEGWQAKWPPSPGGTPKTPHQHL